MICIRLLLILLAPWLPPKASTIGKSFSNPIRFRICCFSSSDIFIFFTLVGVPVTTAFLALGNLSLASANPKKIQSAFLLNIFTAIPGKALLSCSTKGTFNCFAAIPAATQIYPPVPMTTSGFSSLIIFFASPTLQNVCQIFLIFSQLILLLKP